MTDMDAVFQALAVLAKQNRELEQRVATLESAARLHSERLDCHGMLLAPRHTIKPVQHYAAMALQVRGDAA